MALADSLLAAIIRADGDAMVMHVGERPYVMVGTNPLHISTHELTLETSLGMLAQLLPPDLMASLEELGAVEHRLPDVGADRFNCVAARGGDDIWIEIRRRRNQSSAVAPEQSASAPQQTEELRRIEPQSTHVAATPEPGAEAAIAAVAAVEEERRLAAEAAAAEEQRRAAAEAAAAEEERRVAEAAAAEERRQLAEAEEERRVAAEAAAEEERRIAAEAAAAAAAAAAEEQRRAAETAAAEEARRRAAEAAAEEERRLAAEAAAEEERRVAAEAAAAEERRVADEQRRLAAAIAASAAAEAAAEEARRRAIEAAAEEDRRRAIEPVQARNHVEPVELGESIESASAPEQVEELRRDKPVEPSPTVVPMTRTVRIEVPPRGPAARSTDIERLLRIAAARGASALFLKSESRPYMRVDGDIRQLDGEAMLSRSDVEAAIVEIAPEEFGKGEVAEWLREYPELGRIRCTTFNDHHGPGLLLRMIATRAANAEQLGLSREVQALATEPQGLVLVAGPRASGKSTLLSALVDLVNRQRAEFVITLERQIRLVHDNKSALVSQREIRCGADEALAAARSALREGPDVLVIDDLVSPHMVPLLLTAASEGLLVFVSISAPSTSDAVQRFVELASPEMRGGVQSAMAESFRGAVAQVLLKKTGGGLVAAREVLLATAPVLRVIGEGQLAQLPHVLESGRKQGMAAFTETLIDYVRAGSVDVREAFRKTPDRERLLAGLKREKIDTSLIERLA